MNTHCETKESCRQKMVKHLKSSITEIIGVIVGAIAGYIYYSFYGCSGGCTITSSPWLSMIWGAILGYLIGGLFTKNKKHDNKD